MVAGRALPGRRHAGRGQMTLMAKEDRATRPVNFKGGLWRFGKKSFSGLGDSNDKQQAKNAIQNYSGHGRNLV
jgi:hypothetical protein